MPKNSSTAYVSNLPFDKRADIGDYLDTSVTSLDELPISAINMILSHKYLTDSLVTVKQKGARFTPSKKIRFCIVPLLGLEVWVTYAPSEDYYIDETVLSELRAGIDDLVSKVLGDFEMKVCDFLRKKPMFFKFEDLFTQLTSLKEVVQSSSWLEEIDLDPLNFPLASKMEREIIIYAGPTNSGKTYHALNHFKSARTGMYVGPLRLNAIEVFESLNEEGIPCDLLTGEEKQLVEGANHRASTVELMDFKSLVDVVLVDEGQFIDDEDRGHSFMEAIAGARAKKVVVTCPIFAVEKIQRLGEKLGLPVSVHLLERKTRLSVTKSAQAQYSDVEKGVAVVAFSKRRLLELKSLMPKDVKLSVIYGALPPEVKREQARRFREGESDIVLATDCIGIGLNLPIRHVVFDTIEKFDGVEKRKLEQQEALQIAGRAGRYGLYEEGFVSGTSEKDHHFLRGAVNTKDKTEMLKKFYIKVGFDVISDYMKLTGKSIAEATRLVYEGISYDKEFFQLSDCQVLVENLRLIDRVSPDLDISKKWKIAHIPLEIDDCEDVFRECLYVASGLASSVELDQSILGSSKPFEQLMLGYQKLLSEIDCVTWFINSADVEFDSLQIDDVMALRSKLVNKVNKSLVQR